MDLISKTLHYIGQNNPNAFVIQIGAMDGVSFDDTRGFLDMYKWKSLLVEPIPELFNELKENFKDRHNYIFEQSAISDLDGDITMLTIPVNVIKENNLDGGYKGMSGIYPLKNGFGSDYQRDIDVKNNYGTNLVVPSLTFNSLLKKHNINHFNILICDVEGYDWKILEQIDLQKYKPDFIRLEYINLTDEEKQLTVEKLESNGYVIEIGQDIDAVLKTLWDKINVKQHDTIVVYDDINKLVKQHDTTVVYDDRIRYDDVKKLVKHLTDTEKLQLLNYLNGKEIEIINTDLTVVTGLWNIGRDGRSFDHYIEHFNKFLEIPIKMFIYIPKEYEYLIWEKRTSDNTFVRIYELDDVKKMYAPFWDKTQTIRTDPNWYNLTGENGWLKNSPQATLEWYNPIVQSKMFFLNDASLLNPFGNEYFLWLDAGITNTVYEKYFTENRALDKINQYLDSFLFLSYQYETTTEIHGFKIDAINQFAGQKVKYVCRGGLFGGQKDIIHQANSTYYSTLGSVLNSGYMGTEESVFSIMAHREPSIYRRYALDENGLVVKFIDNLINDNIELEPIITQNRLHPVTDHELSKIKTNLYVLTFNFPEQFQHIITCMEKVPEWLETPKLFLLDNSTIEESKIKNKEIAEQHNFTYIDLNGNSGICGGRQAAAEHFDQSDADFMLFFEDDMTINSSELDGKCCRNGFRKYVPNLYKIIHKIMLKEDFDFLKLSFTEVYFDNDKQCSWYNVPQTVRTSNWPHYDKLPVNGLDPNVPLTEFKNIRTMDEVSYIDGEVYYANWPMIVSKKGNKKMFIDTKWGHPFEQTWMSHNYQLTKEGLLKPALLLCSPIYHDRIKHYKPEERREN